MPGNSRLDTYEERLRRQGRVDIGIILPHEDGGTGHRWDAGWAPGADDLVDYDASGETLEQALVFLALALGEEVLALRAKLRPLRTLAQREGEASP